MVRSQKMMHMEMKRKSKVLLLAFLAACLFWAGIASAGATSI
jgi:hypothetical protein